ncbi:YicC/YloC family endoribonuclease [Aureimonas frigidaquae]|uniref:YicC family protein n=1 Tax=Aureimonas frigidaquae TaxID=424757 RepID=A0A0P0Z2W3_9HYPH|nr:YicC/YloC family endoribonuclease [Aureimonas frigidaquae]BAT28311.1 hypothetical protein [Aureimonas frigidaquae]
MKPVCSMTGFARQDATFGDWRIVWELRSVNGKGLDLRWRLPPGFEPVEAEARRRAASRLSRGNVQITLQIQRDGGTIGRAINRDVLSAYVAQARLLVSEGHAAPPTADGLLGLKGVLDAGEADTPVCDAPMAQVALDAFDASLEALIAMRAQEGAATAQVLRQRLDEIAALTGEAEEDPSRSAESIRARLTEQVQLLLGTGLHLDEGRLAQEAALLATRADIREEIDRLRAHIEAGRSLLAEGGPIGRRLDFLSQEFNRESNTLCAKSNATSLTAIGLQLKVVVDQFREQVQNIE